MALARPTETDFDALGDLSSIKHVIQKVSEQDLPMELFSRLGVTNGVVSLKHPIQTVHLLSCVSRVKKSKARSSGN